MRHALVSLFDKQHLLAITKLLIEADYIIISTGGTYQAIRSILLDDNAILTDKNLVDIRLVQVSEFTMFPEILNGRVKTLHPRIYGGILARRDTESHLNELVQHNIPLIDVVVCNLYPFNEVNNDTSLDDATELIDIGGVTLIRAAAKNWKHVTVLVDPEDYVRFDPNILNKTVELSESTESGEILELHNDIAYEFRRYLAIKAFKHTSKYDQMISNYFSGESTGESVALNEIGRSYVPSLKFKYGCNPHQSNSFLALIRSNGALQNPLQVLNGEPGYINMLDALNGWQLVNEAAHIFGKNRPVVASFKHTSPAGVAVHMKTDANLSNFGPSSGRSYVDSMVTSTFEAARDCDPMCSFGDFISISQLVDKNAAEKIKPEVSDGIIAPDYSPEAIEILSKKKGGKFLILKMDPNYQPKHDLEVREMFGLALTQAPNVAVVDRTVFSDPTKIVTSKKELPAHAMTDMLLANVTLKYAQSNNIVMAKDGIVIGVAAGQQSRVDAVKLAGRKATTWWLRRHPKVLGHLNNHFKPAVKRQDRINAIIRYVEGDFTPIEYTNWLTMFDSEPEPLNLAEKNAWISQLSGVSMASDAFFPFRDNIDHASKYGISYVIQPGGSQADPQIIEACNQYGMVMVMTGVRQFTH